jgi:hypothetical protein
MSNALGRSGNNHPRRGKRRKSGITGKRGPQVSWTKAGKSWRRWLHGEFLTRTQDAD